MKKHIHPTVLFIVFFAFFQPSWGQNSKNKFLEKWGYDINSVSFFSNKEFNSNLMKGYTLSGGWLKAALCYNVNSQLSLTGGIIAQTFFGDLELQNRHPFIIKAQYKPTQNMRIVFGDIHSSTHHNLPNYLFNSNLLLQDPIEEGLLISFNNSLLRVESWIDWEVFIFEDSPYREEFVFGTTGDYQLSKTKNYKNILNFALLVKHKGGEIDSSPLSVQTLLNANFGFMQTFTFNDMVQMNFGSDIVYYLNNSGTPEIPIKRGYAFNVKSGIAIKHWQLIVDYWHSNNFYSIKGDPYFNNYIDGIITPRRNCMTFSQNWSKAISESSSIMFSNRILYDFSQTKMDLYTTVKLVIDINNRQF